ncbi:flagellar assembly protein FliH [Thioalkalivibrio denitrificans]|uniref:Flagellar assembly protein FliH n=1 Tax=Thioalkalivibrio denitrificans TaxID=108003 RepID=A0A1V3NMY2_9GAMM|nr:flagellar assembly protein FliH [Thioalkalivibrio denitrificans]OOG26192.1 flagellar assembly protein FliH [Thioalkalivibrio denitrificans]
MIQRVISGEHGEAAQLWEAPSVAGASARPTPAQGKAQAHGLPTAERIEDIERQAREEGYQKGLEEGRKAGRDALAREGKALHRLVSSLTPTVEDLDARLEDELVTLAVTVARQLVRRELRTDPGQIVAVVREALGVLPSSERRIRLHLHPEDARIVREAMHLSELEQPWQIFEDPTLSRGGTRVETDVSSVDATLETRLNAVIAEFWGERRDDARTEGHEVDEGDAQA